MSDDYGDLGSTYAFRQAPNDDARNALLDILYGNYPQQVGYPQIPGASGQVGYEAQAGFPVSGGGSFSRAPDERRRRPRNALLKYLTGLDV